MPLRSQEAGIGKMRVNKKAQRVLVQAGIESPERLTKRIRQNHKRSGCHQYLKKRQVS